MKNPPSAYCRPCRTFNSKMTTTTLLLSQSTLMFSCAEERKSLDASTVYRAADGSSNGKTRIRPDTGHSVFTQHLWFEEKRVLPFDSCRFSSSYFSLSLHSIDIARMIPTRITRSTASTGGHQHTSVPYQKPYKPRPPVFDVRYNSGDMTIRSSDKVVFKLHSFYLLAARCAFHTYLVSHPLMSSSVMRDMYAIGSPGSLELELYDKQIESATTVRLWLDIMISQDDPIISQSNIREYERVLHLARKYDCGQVIRTILLALNISLDDNTSISTRYPIIAATFDCPALAEKYCRLKGSHVFVDPPSGGLGHMKAMAVGGPCNWSLAAWREIPAEYTWAMQRAYKSATSPGERADHFRSLMAKIKGEYSQPISV